MGFSFAYQVFVTTGTKDFTGSLKFGFYIKKPFVFSRRFHIQIEIVKSHRYGIEIEIYSIIDKFTRIQAQTNPRTETNICTNIKVRSQQ